MRTRPGWHPCPSSIHVDACERGMISAGAAPRRMIPLEVVFMARTSRWARTVFAVALAGAMCVAPMPFGVQAAGQKSTADSRSRIDRLEAGVRAQEGVRAVKRLQHTYGHYLDSGLWSDAADLFTDDAVGQFQGTTVRGKDNLRRHFMSEAGRPAPGLAPGQLNAHLVLQP